MTTRVVAVCDYSSPLFNQLACNRGEVLHVDWAKSTQGWLWCKRNVPPGSPEEDEGLVPANHLRETWKEEVESLGLPIIATEMENDVVKFIDPVLQHSPALVEEPSAADAPQSSVSSLFGGGSGSGTLSLFGGSSSSSSSSSASTSSLFSGSFSLASAMESQANQPPILAPGLSCLIWPMHPVEFMTKIWQKKAYVVQGCGERLQKVKQDFMNYDVEQLVSQASDCVVWMKTTDGKIQHLYADNKTAYHCYLAGHSLYFNPPVALQKSYIKQLAEDLGANFGLKKDDGFGGDIEIFAVRGKHVTDWHFDAQENFTIQLTGRKRWSISPGVFCPITNHTNPKNIATEKYDEHRKVHASYAPAADVEPPKDFSQAQTFVLRPGSVMYVPAGYWHHVTCDSDEGSLSINFSMSTSSWLDLLMNSLGQHLWKYQHWRENIIVKDPSSARAHLQALLTNLPREIGLLSARDFLPQGLFREHKEREVNVDTSEQGTEVEITKDTVLRRNPVAVIIKDKLATTSAAAAAAAAKKPACPPPAACDKGGRKRALQSVLGDDKEGGGDDDDSRERQGKESWTLHLAFGNKDFKSSLEAKIFVKRAMGCVLEWVERRHGARGPDAANEADGGRWAAFTAGQLYAESGYRDLVKARKAARDQRRKRRRGEDQNTKAKRHVRKNEDDDEEGMGRFEDEDDEDDEDEMDEEEQREGAVGGFGDVEQLLSVLVFNGYLTKVKSNKAKEGAE